MERSPWQDLRGLLERCRTHEEAAWQDFHGWFRRLSLRVLTRFSTLTPLEREEAQDAARVRLAIVIAQGGITGTSTGEIISFAKTVIENCARSVWKRRRPTEALPPLLRDEGPSPWEATKFSAELDCAKRLIASWSPDDRFVFMMKQEHVSTAAIRRDLERLFGIFVTASAVDTRFSRLRTELRRRCFGGP